MMNAFGFYEHGAIENMQFFQTSIPQIKPNEVLVEIKASAFNHLDIWVRRGIPGLKLALPHISGSDAAGIVHGIGSDVRDISLGSRVVINPGINLKSDEFTLTGRHSVSPSYKIFGEQIPGTHTEFVAVPCENILTIPESTSFVEAAASGLVCITAWRMLITQSQLQAGQSVFVIGAGGGVNSVAIQIAKLAGCRVTTITSSDEKVSQAYALGADVVLNYKTQNNWLDLLLEQTKKAGFDLVVDNVGAATMKHSLRLVKRGGTIIVVGNTSGPIVDFDLRYLFSKQIKIIGSTMGSPNDFQQVMKLVFDKKIKTPIFCELPFEKALEGMHLLENGEQFGKIVLTR